MLHINSKSQIHQQASVPIPYTQYTNAALNFILASSMFLFFKTTGTCWPLSVAGAEAAEIYEQNTDAQNPISIREETTLQNYPSYLTQHRSLQQTTPQSDTIITGNLIGQLSLNDKITDYTVRDNYAYVTAGESGFHIIDVRDASNPIPLGQYQTTGFAHQLQLVDSDAYIAYDLAGLRIVDVSNVSNPFLAGVYMMGDNPEKEAVTQVAIAGGVAILGRPDSTELKAIDVSDPTQVFRVWIDTPGFACALTVVGNFTYVADHTSGLQIIDVSNPTNPQLVGSYHTPGSAKAVAVVGNLAYVADYDVYDYCFHIIDVSNPTNPQLVRSYDAPDEVRDVTVIGSLAYVAADRAGLQIIDVSNTTNPQLVGSYDTPAGTEGVTIVGDLAYVAAGWEGLQIIDVSNPTNPQLVGSYKKSVESVSRVAVVGNLAYVSDFSLGLKIINISNSTNPHFMGTYNTPDFAHDATVIGNLAYVATLSAGLQIIDVSNSTNPKLVGSHVTPDSAYGVAVVNNLAYVSDYRAGLQIIDTNTSQLLVFFSFDNQALEQQLFSYNSYLFLTIQNVGLVCINKHNLAYKGHDASGFTYRRVAVVSNLAYVTVADVSSSGLQIIDVSNSTNPQLVGSYYTSGYARGVAVIGNLAYVADGNAGLQVIDVSNSTNPQLVASYDMLGSANSAIIVNNLAYVAGGSSGLQIIDISNQSSPALADSYIMSGSAFDVTVIGNLAYVIGSIVRNARLQIIDLRMPSPYIGYTNTVGDAYDVAIVGNFAYVAVYDAGLQIIDVSNPVKPQLMGSYDSPRLVFGVTVVGNLAYLAGYSGLDIIDVSNLTNPQLVGNYDTPGYAYGVTVVGNLAYVADGPSGLQIVDVSNPTNPQLVGNYDTPGRAEAVTVVGNLAYVADNRSGLQIIDVSNSTNSQLVGSYDTSGNADSVTVIGNLAYLADGDSGLQIIDISNSTNPQLVGNYKTLAWAHDVTVTGNLAYVANGAFGLQIINVNNPTNPQLVGSYDTSGYARGVAIIAHLAYVADGRSGLQIIDLTISTQYLVGSYAPTTRRSFSDITVAGNLAYLVGDSCLDIIDISNPANTQLVGSYKTSTYASGVTIVGNLAYVAGGCLQTIGIDNPTRSQLMRSFNTVGNAARVDIANNAAYVADGKAGLQTIDLSFQNNTFATEGPVSYMTAFGNILYLTDTYQNLYIIDITDSSNMTAISRYQLAYHASDIVFSDYYLYVAQGLDGIEIIDVQNPYAPIQVTHNIADIKDVSNLEIDNNRLYIENMAGEVQIIALSFLTPDAPTILNNRLIVNEGDYIAVTPNDLSATNIEIPDTAIEFIIEDVMNGQFEDQSERDTIINRFTQQQLIDGKIRFASLSLPGVLDPTVFYQIAATNGIQSAFDAAVIDFNARPRLIKNDLKIKRGEIITIGSQELSATDFDDNDADLRFEIFNIQHGEFRWEEGAPTQQFWQRNITDGLIQFRHDNSDNSPSYQVSVYDKRMVVGNDTVRVTFDRASFTEANNTPVIVGGIIGGAAGLGLIGFGLFAVGRHINNTRSRKKHPFADYLARELKLPGVENFETPQGKTYLAAVNGLITALQDNGYDVMHMDATQQKELATDIALTAKHNLGSEVNCCGETNITPRALQQHASALISSMLQYRLQGQQNSFEQIPLDEELSFLENGIAQVRQFFSQKERADDDYVELESLTMH